MHTKPGASGEPSSKIRVMRAAASKYAAAPIAPDGPCPPASASAKPMRSTSARTCASSCPRNCPDSSAAASRNIMGRPKTSGATISHSPGSALALADAKLGEIAVGAGEKLCRPELQRDIRCWGALRPRGGHGVLKIEIALDVVRRVLLEVPLRRRLCVGDRVLRQVRLAAGDRRDRVELDASDQ